MKPLIIANWKCNPESLKKAEKLFDLIKKGVKDKSNVIICPPFVYLSSFKGKGLTVGAQDCFWKKSGSFTGEISPTMIKKMGIDYVILGHSERRKYFKESNETINRKIKLALKEKLKVIFCVGEKEEKKKVIEEQVKEGLKGVSQGDMKNLLIAYEPVWAIGTGRACSVEETMSSVLLIRKIVSGIYSRKLADNLKVLYGGSVNRQNAGEYKKAGVNGLLIGGASLKAGEFIKIANL